MAMGKRIVMAALLAAATFAPASLAVADPPPNCSGADVNEARTTDNADFLTGTDGPDVASLGDGPDQYFAAEANDTLCGNQGDDVLAGEAGSDNLNGGTGDDVLAGLGGADTLVGAGGADELQGGSGDDRLAATTDDDVRDDLYDGLGSDVIIGHAEDFWHRCPDDEADDHDAFTGTVVTEPDC